MSETLGIEVACFVPGKNVAEQLVLSRSVRLKGRVRYTTNQIPVLEDCAIVELGPDTATRVNAAEWTKNWASNWEQTAQKLDGVPVVVSGVVTSIHAGRMGEPNGEPCVIVEMKGPNGIPVNGWLSGGTMEEARWFVGNEIRISGRFVKWLTSAKAAVIEKAAIVD